MDYFKRKMSKNATAWDWDCPRFVKRHKGDTKKLHRIARRKLKNELKSIDNNK